MKKLITVALILITFSSCTKNKVTVCAENVNEYVTTHPTYKADLVSKIRSTVGGPIIVLYDEIRELKNSDNTTYYSYVVYTLNGFNYVGSVVYDCTGKEIVFKTGL